MRIEKPDCFALTGGPGSGKTTLLAELRARGIAVTPDHARAVIQAEGGRPEPGRFCRLVMARDVEAFQRASGLTLFDRTLVDAWAMTRVYGVEAPEAEAAVRDLRFNRVAFIAPPWRAIYRTDTERDQTWADAVRAYEASLQAYQEAGYELVELPLVDAAHRAEFVLAQTSQTRP